MSFYKSLCFALCQCRQRIAYQCTELIRIPCRTADKQAVNGRTDDLRYSTLFNASAGLIRSRLRSVISCTSSAKITVSPPAYR